MRVLLDANVLIALVDDAHVHHEPAEIWLEAWPESFATCPVTQGSLVRHLLRGKRPIVDILAVLSLLEGAPRHEFWTDHLSYAAVDLTGVIGHRQVTDAYLAGLARARDGQLATFDRGLAALHPDVAVLVDT